MVVKRKKKEVRFLGIKNDQSYILITIINLLIVTYFFSMNPDLKRPNVIYDTNELVYNMNNIIRYLPIFDIFLGLLLSIGLGIGIFYSLTKILKGNLKKNDICNFGYALGIFSPILFIITFYIFVNLNMPYNYVSFISPLYLCYGVYLITNIIILLIITSKILKYKK